MNPQPTRTPLADLMVELAIEDADVASDDALSFNQVRSCDPSVGRWFEPDEDDDHFFPYPGRG